MGIDGETAKSIGAALGSLIVTVVSSRAIARWKLRKQDKLDVNVTDEIIKRNVELNTAYLVEITRLRGLNTEMEVKLDLAYDKVRRLENDLWKARNSRK